MELCRRRAPRTPHTAAVTSLTSIITTALKADACTCVCTCVYVCLWRTGVYVCVRVFVDVCVCVQTYVFAWVSPSRNRHVHLDCLHVLRTHMRVNMCGWACMPIRQLLKHAYV